VDLPTTFPTNDPTMIHIQRPLEPSRSTTMLSQQRHHINRLPTPDASANNSDDSIDVGGSPPAAKRIRYDPVLQQSFEVSSAARPVNPKDWSRSRADSGVHSPPYQAAEIRRPFLPPLKSVSLRRTLLFSALLLTLHSYLVTTT
jgi:hypothetical protein